MVFVLCLLILNALGLLLMLADKRRARFRAWRIPEAALIAVAVLGGSIGSYAGMYLFHHKIRKPKFYLGIPLILILQLLAVMYLCERF